MATRGSGSGMRGKKMPTNPAKRNVAKKKNLVTKANEDRALELRLQGYTYDEIAKEMGITRPGAWGIIMRVLHQMNDDIKEKVTKRETSTRTVVTSGEITSSLYAAARRAGLSPSAIATMTDEIFKYDIDFDSDLDADDRFSVVVDQTWREGELISTSPVLAATFTVDGKLHSGFRFSRPNSKPEYFTAQGRPLKKTFIRMPIPYARLSSKFGARRHPVLGTMRMHKGVDYAASTGTPIMAAGDSRVEFIGWQRGYGNVVILNHGRGYTTLYGHMSRTAKLRKGKAKAKERAKKSSGS